MRLGVALSFAVDEWSNLNKWNEFSRTKNNNEQRNFSTLTRMCARSSDHATIISLINKFLFHRPKQSTAKT